MGLVGKVKGFGVGMIVGQILKAAAEGRLGPAVKWLYWHLRGIKTVVAITFGAIAGIIAVLDHYGICAAALQHWAWVDCAAWTGAIVKGTASISAFFLWIGQIDGSLHLDAPDLSLDEAIASFGK